MLWTTVLSKFGIQRGRGAVAVVCLGVGLLGACHEASKVEIPQSQAVDLIARFDLADAQRTTQQIDLGSAAARRHLISGWADVNRELDGEDRMGTWTMGDAAELDFFVLRPMDLDMTMRCAPVQAHGTEAMELSINGQALTSLTLQAGLRPYTLTLGKDVLRPGWNRLSIGHQGSGQRGIKKDTRVLWDAIEFRPAGAESSSQAATPEPKPIARPDGGTLFVPFDSRLDYYLELPPHSALVVDQVRSRGSASGRLEIVWQSREEGAEAVHLQDLTAAPEFAFALTQDAPQSGRLSLTASAGEALRDQSMGILMHGPRIMGGGESQSGKTSPTEQAVSVPSSTEPSSTEPSSTEPSSAGPTGATAQEAGGTGKRMRPNVLVYIVDTLRADHLGCYGYELPTSPRLDAFAEQATLFENSQAQTPWTRASVASMLTGMWPQSHGTNGDDDALSEDAITLAEALGEVGYRTAAITGNGNAARVAGFAQGFDYFKYLRNLRPDEPLATSTDINEAVFSWLDDRGDDSEPFFLWVHTIDPHAPYDPPEPFREAFAPGVDEGLGSIETIVKLSGQQEKVDSEVIDDLVELYDAEIAANDASFGALLDDLERRGLYEDLVVVFLSDHGEEFYEHGGWTHGKTLHSEMLDTPLVFRLPGAPAGRSPHVVQHVDLMPTLLEVAGATRPAGVQGRSFLPLILAPDTSQWLDQGMAFLDLRGRRGHSFIDARWKLIQYEEGDIEGFPELYDREKDRPEATNLAPQEPEVARFLAALRRQHETALEEGLGPAVVDAEERAKVEAELRALGYIQ